MFRSTHSCVQAQRVKFNQFIKRTVHVGIPPLRSVNFNVQLFYSQTCSLDDETLLELIIKLRNIIRRVANLVLFDKLLSRERLNIEMLTR